MKTQLKYLSFILTFIAVALSIIILQNMELIPKAKAAHEDTVNVHIESCSAAAFQYVYLIKVEVGQ